VGHLQSRDGVVGQMQDVNYAHDCAVLRRDGDMTEATLAHESQSIGRGLCRTERDRARRHNLTNGDCVQVLATHLATPRLVTMAVSPRVSFDRTAATSTQFAEIAAASEKTGVSTETVTRGGARAATSPRDRIDMMMQI